MNCHPALTSATIFAAFLHSADLAEARPALVTANAMLTFGQLREISAFAPASSRGMDEAAKRSG